ncbi:MAG: hypothetical protein VW405_11555 [Rhodospirillaceae bacterium]
MLAALRALRTPPPLYRVRIDDRVVEARTVIVTRARCYGGPFVLTPEAGLERPGLHVVILGAFGLVAALRYGLALAMGRLQRHAEVTFANGPWICIEGPDGDPVQMDGDVASGLTLSVSLAERSVPILVRG